MSIDGNTPPLLQSLVGLYGQMESKLSKQKVGEHTESGINKAIENLASTHFLTVVTENDKLDLTKLKIEPKSKMNTFVKWFCRICSFSLFYFLSEVPEKKKNKKMLEDSVKAIRSQITTLKPDPKRDSEQVDKANDAITFLNKIIEHVDKAHVNEKSYKSIGLIQKIEIPSVHQQLDAPLINKLLVGERQQMKLPYKQMSKSIKVLLMTIEDKAGQLKAIKNTDQESMRKSNELCSELIDAFTSIGITIDATAKKNAFDDLLRIPAFRTALKEKLIHATLSEARDSTQFSKDMQFLKLIVTLAPELLNEEDEGGMLPANYACMDGKLKAAQILIPGTDAAKLASSKNEPVPCDVTDLEVMKKREAIQGTALQIAIKQGSTEIVQLLVEKFKSGNIQVAYKDVKEALDKAPDAKKDAITSELRKLSGFNPELEIKILEQEEEAIKVMPATPASIASSVVEESSIPETTRSRKKMFQFSKEDIQASEKAVQKNAPFEGSNLPTMRISQLPPTVRNIDLPQPSLSSVVSAESSVFVDVVLKKCGIERYDKGTDVQRSARRLVRIYDKWVKDKTINELSSAEKSALKEYVGEVDFNKTLSQLGVSKFPRKQKPTLQKFYDSL